MPRYDLPRAAEGPLRLVQLFVNTIDVEHRRDWWPTTAALGRWLEEQGFPTRRVTNADLQRARELREALRELLRENNLGGEAEKAAPVVNAAAAQAGVGLELQPAATLGIGVRGAGLDQALGQVIAAAYGAMLDGSWTRLKACRQCSWVFFDTSKNRSGSWCSMQLCGNRTKTRAYRRRKAADGQG